MWEFSCPEISSPRFSKWRTPNCLQIQLTGARDLQRGPYVLIFPAGFSVKLRNDREKGHLKMNKDTFDRVVINFFTETKFFFKQINIYFLKMKIWIRQIDTCFLSFLSFGFHTMNVGIHHETIFCFNCAYCFLFLSQLRIIYIDHINWFTVSSENDDRPFAFKSTASLDIGNLITLLFVFLFCPNYELIT